MIYLTLSWGRLRGGLSIALALSVPALQSHAWTLPATYLVVVLSVLVQGGTFDLFLKRIGHYQYIPLLKVLGCNHRGMTGLPVSA